MNKQWFVITLALAIGVGAGYKLALEQGEGQRLAGSDMSDASGERQPLFWRNPMNPAITSPTFMQDEMGMDYLPVYADQPAEEKKERQVLFWRNPMNPAITAPTFMQDEMGMDYLPVYADQGEPEELSGTVRIDPVTVQNIGVRTVLAERRVLGQEIRAPGLVTYDESRLYRIHPRVEGWVERVFIGNTGQAVAKDDILLELYSPKLVTGQREYLLALESYERLGNSDFPDIRNGAREMVTIARERLKLLDVPEHQIVELERSREVKRALHVHSPYQGVVTAVGARDGQYVTPKSEFYRIADLSKVWVDVDVYESEISLIHQGDRAEMVLKGIPGERFTGSVSHIFPYAEAKTRTIKVRIEFDNPELKLKPDMFADVVIHAREQREMVVIPSEAVVRSGEREQVFVVRGPGKFEPRVVVLGQGSGGWVQILSGVEAGEEVVSSAMFLIDSESKLREATAKMVEALRAGSATGDSEMSMDEMGMGEMDMGEMVMEGLSLDADELSMDDLSLDGVAR